MYSNTVFKNFIFNNNSIDIILDKNNKQWFKAKDIAKILEYSDTKQAIRQHVSQEDRKKRINLRPLESIDLTYNEKNTIFINKIGLHSLILSSKKEVAKILKKWIIMQDIPLIKKHRKYNLKGKLNKLTKYFNKQLLIRDELLQKKEEILHKKEEILQKKEEILQIKEEILIKKEEQLQKNK